MWEWLTGNLRRRSRRRTERQAVSSSTLENPQSTSQSGPSSPSRLAWSPFTLSNKTNDPFFAHHIFSSSTPKCVSTVTCSQLLYGERVEDFSTDCWLEEHLHRFGYPDNVTAQQALSTSVIFEEDSDDDNILDSDDNDSDIFNLNDGQDSDGLPSRPRIALQDLFFPPDEIDSATIGPDDEINCNIVDLSITPPPPYSERDLPPSYEEAIGVADRRSVSSRSTSSSLAFIW